MIRNSLAISETWKVNRPKAEIQPACRSIDGMPDARNQYQGQQDNRPQHQCHAITFPELQWNSTGYPQHCQAEQDPQKLALGIEEWITGILIGNTDRRRGHHHQTEAEQCAVKQQNTTIVTLPQLKPGTGYRLVGSDRLARHRQTRVQIA